MPMFVLDLDLLLDAWAENFASDWNAKLLWYDYQGERSNRSQRLDKLCGGIPRLELKLLDSSAAYVVEHEDEEIIRPSVIIDDEWGGQSGTSTTLYRGAYQRTKTISVDITLSSKLTLTGAPGVGTSAAASLGLLLKEGRSTQNTDAQEVVFTLSKLNPGEVHVVEEVVGQSKSKHKVQLTGWVVIACKNKNRLHSGINPRQPYSDQSGSHKKWAISIQQVVEDLNVYASGGSVSSYFKKSLKTLSATPTE